jgi:hypothetical protein
MNDETFKRREHMSLVEARVRAALREWFESGGTASQLHDLINHAWENKFTPDAGAK